MKNKPEPTKLTQPEIAQMLFELEEIKKQLLDIKQTLQQSRTLAGLYKETQERNELERNGKK